MQHAAQQVVRSGKQYKGLRNEIAASLELLSKESAVHRVHRAWNMKRVMRIVCAALLLSWHAGVVNATSWSVSVDERSGLPLLSRGGTEALSASFAFWGKDWAFADQETDFRIAGPFAYNITGKNLALDLDLLGGIRKTGERQLSWDFDIDAHTTLAGVVGGGLAFRFDLARFGPTLGEPQLLAGNRGWSWGRADSARIEMRFDPPAAALYFEGGNKSEIRAFFYKGSIAAGRKHYLATMTLAGDVALGPTSSERFGLADFRTWPAGILDPNTSPVDLSFLNDAEKPAGRRGFVKARADKLVFADGTPVRFWGTNLTAYALFGTSTDNVRKQAHRLSQLGFNLVRLHHHDSEWVDPNVFGSRDAADTRTLDDAMLDKLDWWIACLKEEGIYVWLDLEDGRRLKPLDGIEGFSEIKQGKSSATLKGYSYVNKSIQAAMRQFNETYLSHQNRYTGLRYQDDPAIAALLITNENDLTNHFGNALLPDKGVPRHDAIYMRLSEEFADKHSFPADKVWRAWEAGPAKLFLNDLEHRFDVDMMAQLRAQGVIAPVVPTSTWGMNPVSSLPALTVGDVIDVHSYGGSGELERNPLYGANLMHWLAAAQVVGKPLSASEWGLDARGTPAADREDIPLYIAAAAALQGWDALMFFAYSQEAFAKGAGTPSVYHAYNDPAMIASLPAAALLYRQGHVREASTNYVFVPSEQTLFYRPESPGTSVALRTAAERGRLLIAMPKVAALPWLVSSTIPAGAKIIHDAQESQLPPGSTQVVSDSGELRRNWADGVFSIDTPRTQAMMGWIGGKPVSLTDVVANVTTRNALIAVQSLDGNPLRRSTRIMISLAARSIPESDNLLPFYSEPVEGTLFITAPAGMTLSARDGRSRKIRHLAVAYDQGRYAVALDRSLQSCWLVLEAKRPRNVAQQPQSSH